MTGKRKAKDQRVPVTMGALVQRINRRLRDDDQVLKVTRGEGRVFNDLGRYYVLNVRLNAVMFHYTDVDPEAFGRELGVLKPYERVVEEGAN